MANFAELKTMFSQFSERTELDNMAQTFFRLGQRKIEGDLEVMAMQKFVPAFNLSLYSNKISVPSDYKKIINLSIIDPNTYSRYDLTGRWSREKVASNPFYAFDPTTYILQQSQSVTQPNITLVLTSGVVTGVTVNSGGGGWLVGSTLRPNASATTNSVLQVASAPNGVVTSFNIINGGSGYSAYTGATKVPALTEIASAALGDVAVQTQSIYNAIAQPVTMSMLKYPDYTNSNNWQAAPFAPGTPRVYWREGGNFFLDYWADKNYVIDMVYYAYQPLLSLDSDANYWSLSAEALMVYAALSEVSVILGEDAISNKWTPKYLEELARVRAADKSERMSGTKKMWSSPNDFSGGKDSRGGLYYDRFFSQS